MYTVELAGQSFDVEAGSREEAVCMAAERMGLEIHTPDVFKVKLLYSGCFVNVLADNSSEAAESAREYMESQKENILDELPHGSHEAATVQDMSTGVEVIEETDDTHYEIRDGHWDEGSLDD